MRRMCPECEWVTTLGSWGQKQLLPYRMRLFPSPGGIGGKKTTSVLSGPGPGAERGQAWYEQTPPGVHDEAVPLQFAQRALRSRFADSHERAQLDSSQVH